MPFGVQVIWNYSFLLLAVHEINGLIVFSLAVDKLDYQLLMVLETWEM